MTCGSLSLPGVTTPAFLNLNGRKNFTDTHLLSTEAFEEQNNIIYHKNNINYQQNKNQKGGFRRNDKPNWRGNNNNTSDSDSGRRNFQTNKGYFQE